MASQEDATTVAESAVDGSNESHNTGGCVVVVVFGNVVVVVLGATDSSVSVPPPDVTPEITPLSTGKPKSTAGMMILFFRY